MYVVQHTNMKECFNMNSRWPDGCEETAQILHLTVNSTFIRMLQYGNGPEMFACSLYCSNKF